MTPRSSCKKKINVKRNNRKLENRNSIQKLWENSAKKEERKLDTVSNVRKFINEIEKKNSLEIKSDTSGDTLDTISDIKKIKSTDIQGKEDRRVGKQTKNIRDWLDSSRVEK